MHKQVETLSKLNPRQIQNELRKQNLPAATQAQLREEALALKEHRRQTRLREQKHAALWRRLVAPLKYELANAKVGMRLKDSISEPERHLAFSEYILVMEKLFGGMEKIRRAADQTPSQFAKQMNYPNGGVHWSDWVSMKTQTRIHGLFDSIPYRPRAKRFTPFVRRMTPDLYRSEQSLLWLRTLNEYDLLMSDLDMARDADKRERLIAQQKRMLFALDRIAFDPKHPCLPFTWHGTHTEDEWNRVDDNDDPEQMERLYQAYHDTYADLLAQAREERGLM